ncbi:MAG: class I SAM-dependent methyltransferase [Burkholderiaceae bacterium]|jgi:SAM-dependent methyltransferase
MDPDRWLERWLPLVAAHAKHSVVLQLGCGSGDDAAALCDAGLDVVGLDISAEAVAAGRAKAPRARIYHQDLREPFPEPMARIGVVVASYSLHYFDWPETIALVARIRQNLTHPGLMLCQVSSTNDEQYGARGNAQISENYFLIGDQPRRFFDRESIITLFARGWHLLSMEERVIDDRFVPETIWEVVLQTEV